MTTNMPWGICYKRLIEKEKKAEYNVLGVKDYQMKILSVSNSFKKLENMEI